MQKYEKKGMSRNGHPIFMRVKVGFLAYEELNGLVAFLSNGKLTLYRLSLIHI